METTKVKSPVLLLLFNRPDCTKKVFDMVKRAMPARLYIAIDGPRAGNMHDSKNVNEVKACILDNINWPCEVKTLFREKNLGCRDAVSSAITWFFEQEEEGIILEDDCLPNSSFFNFCDELLERYRTDDRVRHISGVNFLTRPVPGTDSYYFSKFTHIWGWASWRRVWKDYDKEMEKLDSVLKDDQLWNIYPDKRINETLRREFLRVKNGQLNTWDFQYLFSNFINNGLTIIPRVSMIENIGFGAGSTHHHAEAFTAFETGEITRIKHPEFFVPQINLDIESFRRMNNLSLKSKLSSKLGKYFPKK